MFNKKMTFQYMAKQITQRKLSLFFFKLMLYLTGAGRTIRLKGYSSQNNSVVLCRMKLYR